MKLRLGVPRSRGRLVKPLPQPLGVASPHRPGVTTAPRRHAALLDAWAVALSTLCLIHCLALPMLAAALPLLGVWAHDEWVHMVLVAIALPLTGFALWRAHARQPLPSALRALAAMGLTGLLTGALGWPEETWETPLTVSGSLMLASAHVWNWTRHRGH